MSYMRGACGVSRWDGESNEDMYGRFGMSESAANTFFQHKIIHRYTWRRGNDYEQIGLIDYVAVDGRLRKDICDAKVVRGMFDGSDHLAVLTKLRLKEKWVLEKKGGVKKDILKIEKLQEKEITEYKHEMAEALSGEWESVKDS